MSEFKTKNNGRSQRIAKNTMVLYFRMLFLMLVSLYTSRVILDALGVDDYGIYNVVGGFVSMFALISAALTSACTRFLNFEMGSGDIDRQNVVFSTAITIQWTLATIVFVLGEAVGVWYVNNVMVIPSDRLVAANWCFQFSVLSFCMNLITVPYNASIVAHERMKAFAYVSVIQGLATLLISFLVFWNPLDRLVYYALLLFLVQFAVRYSYQYYCKKHFEECHYRRVFDKPLLKSMLSYSVWHLLGNGANILKTHGVNIVLNLYFGPVVNAARGIANQVDSAVNQFANNFMMAMNPQITQSYAKGDLGYMFSLLEKGSKYSFYLMFVISLPIILNAEYILNLWLKRVPDYAVIFVQLSLVAAMISCLSRPLITAQNATGNVRNYQLVVGCINLLNLPLCYLGLHLGYSPASVMFVLIVVEIIAMVARIFMLPYTVEGFQPFVFLKKVPLHCLALAFVSLILPVVFDYYYWDNSFLIFIVSIIVCVISTSVIIWIYGINKSERSFIKTKVVFFIKIK